MEAQTAGLRHRRCAAAPRSVDEDKHRLPLYPGQEVDGPAREGVGVGEPDRLDLVGERGKQEPLAESVTEGRGELLVSLAHPPWLETGGDLIMVDRVEASPRGRLVATPAAEPAGGVNDEPSAYQPAGDGGRDGETSQPPARPAALKGPPGVGDDRVKPLGWRRVKKPSQGRVERFGG